MKKAIAALFACIVCATGWSGGKAESAASSSVRGQYLAGIGVISPANEVLIDSYIASIDYRYPRLASGIGVYLYTGNQQVSSAGQEEVIHIGIQGPETAFEELAPMNLVFVIDHSGSMMDADKLEWVKKAFEVFIGRVRDRDFVSLVVFDNTASILFPSTRMDSPAKRQRFADAVRGIQGGGGTNLLDGLYLGYGQAMTNFRSDYTNRVLFLTDGIDNVDHVRQMMELAGSYRQTGINVSTIGVGRSFDLKLMNDLARQGGGSSRFISDVKEMQEMFGSELDRMVVPAGRDLRMTLELEPGVELAGTWGYGNKVTGSMVRYELPTLHNRDYETILASVRIGPSASVGRRRLASFSLGYRDLAGASHFMGPFPVEVEVVSGDSPVTGFSDGMVLHSGTMLHFAQTLVGVGEVYYSARSAADPAEKMKKLKRCLDITVAMKKELLNAQLRLDDRGFEKELGIMDQYLKILGKDLALEDGESSRIAGDQEIAPPAPDRPLDESLHNLFREMVLDARIREGGAIAISGFMMNRKAQPQLCSLLNEMGMVELSRVDKLRPVERQRLDDVLKEQELALSDLVDTSKAIMVGKVLAARYILTGSVIEMPSSVVIFGRVVNVETSEVESAAQVIVPKSKELAGLLL
jgi:hypothetical protein